jgi:tRNA-modifying protein YgfZ
MSGRLKNMVIDLTERSKFRVSGTDRLRYLNGQLTNDLRGLLPGNAKYACALTPKGKLAADLYVAAGPEDFWIDAASAVRESLAIRLERYVIADDVLIEDVTDEYRLLHFFDEEPPSPSPGEVMAIKNDRFRAAGVDLWLPVSASRDQLQDLRILGPQEAEQLRIERGIPLWGAELSEEVIPAEAGLDESAISFTKGCYLGQEVISRIKSIGHVNRHLRGLQSIKGAPPIPGDQLCAAENPDKSVGRITSVSPATGGAPFALGYVRRGFAQSGTILEIRRQDRSDLIGSVEIRHLPFTVL